MESVGLKSRSPFSTETDIFYCLRAQGRSWAAAVGFLGLPGSNMYQFRHWRHFLFYNNLSHSMPKTEGDLRLEVGARVSPLFWKGFKTERQGASQGVVLSRVRNFLVRL